MVRDGRWGIPNLSREIITFQFVFSLLCTAKDLIKRLLTVDPKRRLTMSQALKHPWMQDKDAIAWAERLMSAENMPPPRLPVSTAIIVSTVFTLINTPTLINAPKILLLKIV